MKTSLLYLERNKGRVKAYRIGNSSAKHFRYEMLDDGTIELVGYSGHGTLLADARDVILLTEEDAKKMSHLQLTLISPPVQLPLPLPPPPEELPLPRMPYRPPQMHPRPTPFNPPQLTKERKNELTGLVLFCTISALVFLAIHIWARFG